MARRRGKPGSWLMTDDYFGFVKYGPQLSKDYWGMFAKKPLLRNLQEIATPLNDPQPVQEYRGPNYEAPPVNPTVAPTFVGYTNVRTSHDNAAFESGAVT